MNKRLFVSLLLAIALTPTARAQQVGTCSPALGEGYLDVGNVRARILNNGQLFSRDQLYVYNVPKGTSSNALFAGGLWIAGQVGSELRAAASRYGPYEFWAGPLDEQGHPPADCGVYDRIYTVSRDDVAAYDLSGTATPDLADWPTGLGAPTVDAGGNEVDLLDQLLAARKDRKIDLAAGERPAFLGDQMLWWVMNDMGNVHESTGANPIGLEVHGLAFAFDDPSVLRNTTFYRYTLRYHGAEPLTDTYVGAFSDPDMGDFGDDWVGSDPVRGVGYVWNSDNEDGTDTGYGTPPPAIGYDFFQGPIVPSPGDVAQVGREQVQDFKNLNATSFVVYGNGGEATTDPVKASDYYAYMRGLHKDGAPITRGGDGRNFSAEPTSFMYDGAAWECGFWSACNATGTGDVKPGDDYRMALSTGPFTLNPGDEQEIVVGIVYAKGSDNHDSVLQMLEADDHVQAFVSSGYSTRPPAAEPLTAIPGLVAPADGVSGQSITMTFVWDCPAAADFCELQVADASTFEGAQTYGGGGQVAVPLQTGREYWWRVRGFNGVGIPGGWSDPWSFSTGDRAPEDPIVDFQVVSNAAGPLDPPECGAFGMSNSGFPLVACGSDRPNGARQQTTASVEGWGIHAGGAGLNFGPESDSKSYLGRSWSSRSATGSVMSILPYDYEWRFTAAGGKAWRAFEDGSFMNVPFELWRIGVNTPDDPSDDVRLIPGICESCGGGTTRSRFDIGGDHAISGGSNDPFSDLIYWYEPDDDSPGDAGYRAFVAGNGAAREIMARQVLVCWNCGEAPPYPQEYPEIGTTFRIVTGSVLPPILSSPASGRTFAADAAIPLYWSVTGSASVALQVASDPGFAGLVADLPGALSGQTVELASGDYFWRVGSSQIGWSDTWTFHVAAGTNTESAGDLPTTLTLGALYPNPAAASVSLRFGLPDAAAVTIDLVDTLGRRTSAYLTSEWLPAGWHDVQLDTQRLASGVYFVRVSSRQERSTRALVVSR